MRSPRWVGLPFSLRLQERGRIFDVDLGSELLDLPSMPGFQGWGDLFDLLERAIGRYKERLDKTAVDEEVLRRALDLIGDDELLSRCTPLLTSVWTSSTEPPASELDEQVSGLDTVVREMSVILENRIRKLSGLSDTTLAGAALVSRAFGGPDAPLRFSTDAGIQESAHFLYRGYAGFVRNEAMHRLIRDYTKRRVLQLL